MSLITVAELALWQRNGVPFTLLDVRRAEKRAADGDEIAGGSWLDPARWLDWKDEVPSDRPVVFYCAYGHEISQGVTAALRAMGVDARHLEGGITDWRSAGQPVKPLAATVDSHRQELSEAVNALVLTRSDVAALMSPADYLDAVTQGFVALGEGRAMSPPPLQVPLAEGGCHAKAARWQDGARCYVAIKFNVNLPSNPQRHGLPTIQGAILLCDGDDGRLLAVLDSIELTLGRTAAATALAARHLARPASRVLAVCGCGAQAWPQVEALRQVLPQLREVRCWDRDAARAAALQQRLLATDGLDARVAGDLEGATGEADVVVTCTTSTEPYLGAGSVGAGCFVAAVGADSPRKSEIAPTLMARAKVVVDNRAQCLEMGDLHHAVAAGAIAADSIHAELADLACGRLPGRRNDDEIWLFDSTGVAIQDVTSAVRAFERAVDRRIGTAIDIAC